MATSEPVLWQIEVLDAEGLYWEEYETRAEAVRMVRAHLDGDPSEMGRTTGRIRPLIAGDPVTVSPLPDPPETDDGQA